MSDSFTHSELSALFAPDTPDIFNGFFRAIHGMPAGWKWCKLNSDPDKVPEGYGHVEGGLRSAKGAWKGRDKSGDRKFFFKFDDLHAFEAKLAAELGVCRECWDKGRTNIGFNVDPSKNRYRKCPTCGGTGKAEVK